MEYHVVVLSQDQAFARMLELEFQYLHLSVRSAPSMEATDRAEVLVLDLDSAFPPPTERYRTMIGFSRKPAMSAEWASRCSMILRRPFRMSSLRQEVLAQIGDGMPELNREALPGVPSDRGIRLDEEAGTLICDRQAVPITPNELRILRCLLQKRGTAVSREELSSTTGRSEANKTDVYICYLRRKTDSLPGGRLIQTIRGKGYQIES